MIPDPVKSNGSRKLLGLVEKKGFENSCDRQWKNLKTFFQATDTRIAFSNTALRMHLTVLIANLIRFSFESLDVDGTTKENVYAIDSKNTVKTAQWRRWAEPSRVLCPASDLSSARPPPT
jgi:hypothetical protein